MTLCGWLAAMDSVPAPKATSPKKSGNRKKLLWGHCFMAGCSSYPISIPIPVIKGKFHMGMFWGTAIFVYDTIYYCFKKVEYSYNISSFSFGII